VSTTEPDSSRAREIERRIEDLEAREEAAFGHFTAWDWTACTVFAVVLPLLGIWRCAA
jgi:hypothetical protein